MEVEDEQAEGAMVIAAPIAPPEPQDLADKKTDWDVINKRNCDQSWRWLSKHPYRDLCMLRGSIEPFMQTFRKQLKLSAKKWEKTNRQRPLRLAMPRGEPYDATTACS